MVLLAPIPADFPCLFAEKWFCLTGLFRLVTQPHVGYHKEGLFAVNPQRE
jgi:hypothetical protein